MLAKRMVVNKAVFNCAKSLRDKYYVSTRFPNGLESVTPYEYITKRDPEDAIVCSIRFINS